MPAQKINYIKLLEKINLNDGTVLDKGTSLRFNYKEGPFYNVEIHESNNVKKIFWITENQGDFTKSRTEKWTKKQLEEHESDLKENWLVSPQEKEKLKLEISNTNSSPLVLEKKKRGRPKKIK